jgi:uncharacterized protein (DUF2249 family)/quercetin dioxygenase-like cupin family protein
MADPEVDVRTLRKPDKHPTIFEAYDKLGVDEAFVLVNNHNPKHLHDEFELEHAGSYDWEYLDEGPDVWRIRISKLASTPLPRVLCDTAAVAQEGSPDVTGAVWKLQRRDRDLDSNVIVLPPDGSIRAHAGPDLDVLIHVISGSGRLVTELDAVDLAPGALVWLPRRSRREFVAGPDGLGYLTVHRRREALVLDAPPRRADR